MMILGKLHLSSDLTVCKTLGILFTWFCSSSGTSKEAFSRLLYILHNFLLPHGNKLPDSYAKALSKVKHLLIPVQKYDCCVNDCLVFRESTDGDFNDLEQCPECEEGRYLPGSKTARKVFKYLPIGPR
jgi:hypothetical protein